MKAILFVFCLICLTACEGTTPWYYNHPTRKIVKIDGHDINVIYRGNKHYDAWESDFGIITNVLPIKQRNVKAIELLTGCKVVDAEMIGDSLFTQATVECKK